MGYGIQLLMFQDSICFEPWIFSIKNFLTNNQLFEFSVGIVLNSLLEAYFSYQKPCLQMEYWDSCKQFEGLANNVGSVFPKQLSDISKIFYNCVDRLGSFAIYGV
jgi:hypothetical protein